MEFQRSETTGCLRADPTGRAADLPAHKAGSLLQNTDGQVPACSSAFEVISHKHTRPSN
jgi:hypothetical protein